MTQSIKFLKSRKRKLSEIAVIGGRAHRIIAATVADTSEYGILVSDPPEGIQDIKKENNVSANLTDVLAIVTSSCAEFLHYLISRKRASA